MKRSKQMTQMIGYVNEYLRRNNIKNEDDPVFQVTMWSLLDQRLYQGFNYFKLKQIGDKTVSVLAGSSTDFDFLQLY